MGSAPGKTGGTGFDLRAALLVEPVKTVKLGQFFREDVAQGGQVPDVEAGVIEKLGRDRAGGPVGLLARLVDGDAEMILEQ